MTTYLADLNDGERAIIERLPHELLQSLSRLGLVPGTEITCLRRLPLGDPTVFRWRGISVALRKRDASTIEVRIQQSFHAVGGGALDAPCQPFNQEQRAVQGQAPTVQNTGNPYQ